MPEPTRLRIQRAIMTTLETITVVNGYRTDAGTRAHLGRVRLGATDDLTTALPALVLTTGRTETPAQGRKLQIRMPIVVTGLVRDDLDDPLAEAELLIADVKTALFGPTFDPTLGGLTTAFEPGEVEPVPREEGTRVMGVSVEAVATYVETRGVPG